PIELDLGGRGVRSMELDPSTGLYWILAGAYDDEAKAALYQWSGRAGDAPVQKPAAPFAGLNPEAVFLVGRSSSPFLQVLSDDGGLVVEGTACKKLPDARKGFRAVGFVP
ncbi:MAG: DUF3616 domain-containing protein, partial [Planctomycetia bacterium]